MKRFQFPLERVRRWRAEQASLEVMKLEQLVEHLARLAQEKRLVESARASSEQEVLAQLLMEATELQNLDAYRLHVKDRIRDIENRQRQTEAAMEQQRQRVIEARRKAELLERLKKKLFAEWQMLAEREEETVAGELYLAKWNHRQARSTSSG